MLPDSLRAPILVAGVACALLAEPTVARAATGDSATSFKDIATGVGAAVGVVLALFGAPSIYLGIKKSQAEIRKLELETAKLQSDQARRGNAPSPSTANGYRIHIEGQGNQVSILADPRLLGPLLLLLDFVTASIVLTVAGYLLSFGALWVFTPVLAIIGIVLFTPIYREARRLKRILGPEFDAAGQRNSASEPAMSAPSIKE